MDLPESGVDAMHRQRNAETHEDQCCVKILIVLLHVVDIILRRLPFVHGEEVKSGVVIPEWSEKHMYGDSRGGSPRAPRSEFMPPVINLLSVPPRTRRAASNTM